MAFVSMILVYVFIFLAVILVLTFIAAILFLIAGFIALVARGKAKVMAQKMQSYGLKIMYRGEAKEEGV